MIVILTESCDKKKEFLDPCANINCNSGTCESGTCNCPEGFSGINCEVESLCFSGNIECENGGICLDGTCNCPVGFMGINCENFDFAQVEILLENHTPDELVRGGIPLDSLYGKMYEGGFIFYVNTIDGSGLVAASVDQAMNQVPWGCQGIDVDGAEGKMIGDGKTNTIDIVAACMTDGIAARLCDELNLNEKSDWFLPSLEELNLMHTNLWRNGHGGFAVGFYWSSTENDSSNAWFQNFLNGAQNFSDKMNTRRVRAARAF